MNEERLADRLDVLINGGSTIRASYGHQDQQRGSSQSQSAYENERLLVAWVLLSRLSPKQVNKVWEEHKMKLLRFARRLLVADDIQGTYNRLLHFCYVRLLARVASILEKSSFDRVSLLHIILDTWKHISLYWKIDDSSQWKMNIDVGNTLFIHLAQKNDRATIEYALNILWTVYSKLILSGEPLSTRSSYANEARVEISEELVLTETRQMILLLESCLGSKEGDNHRDAEEYNKDTWEKLVFTFFDMKQEDVSETMAVKVLRWVFHHNQDLSKEAQCSWHKWMMRFAITRYSQNDASLFLSGSDEMDMMQKILLAHAVSPDKSALRALSWQAVPIIFKNVAWKSSADSSINSPICLWSRLASGEWKITLQKGGFFSSEDKATLDGCGHTLISIVHFLVSFDDQPVLPLDATALLCIKDSLEDAVSTASEYLALNSLQRPEPIVVSVWCQILAEEDLAIVRSLDTAIAALKMLLRNSTEGHCHIDESIVILLAHVQSAADNNDRVRNLVRPIKKSIKQYLDKV
jgi:hypothetical protein